MSNNGPKKPRADSKLDAMPESRVLELRDMLMASKAYKDIHAWLFSECGVTVDSSALTRFYKRHCAPLVREQRQFAAVKAETIIDGAGRTDWNAATMELVKQVSFELMSGEALDPKLAEKFIKLILKADAQDAAREKASDLRQSKVEAGLDVMHAEIQNNPAALKAFAALKEALKR